MIVRLELPDSAPAVHVNCRSCCTVGGGSALTKSAPSGTVVRTVTGWLDAVPLLANSSVNAVGCSNAAAFGACTSSVNPATDFRSTGAGRSFSRVGLCDVVVEGGPVMRGVLSAAELV